METFENILTRRSVRAFSPESIKRSDLEKICKAAIYAPSGMNRQTWCFVVIDNTEKIQRLAAAVGAALGREGYNFYAPAAFILTTNERESRWGADDCACALQNIFLEAHELGIGSVWINQVREVCDVPEVREILTELGVLPGHVVYGCAALGYAAAEPKEAVKNSEVIIWA